MSDLRRAPNLQIEFEKQDGETTTLLCAISNPSARGCWRNPFRLNRHEIKIRGFLAIFDAQGAPLFTEFEHGYPLYFEGGEDYGRVGAVHHHTRLLSTIATASENHHAGLILGDRYFDSPDTPILMPGLYKAAIKTDLGAHHQFFHKKFRIHDDYFTAAWED